MEKKTYTESADFGRFTEKEMHDLKLKYGKRLRYLKVETSDGISEFIIKKPSRATAEAVADALEKKDQSAAANIMILNCVVAGDTEDIDEDAQVYAQVTTFISSLADDVELSVKKL